MRCFREAALAQTNRTLQPRNKRTRRLILKFHFQKTSVNSLHGLWMLLEKVFPISLWQQTHSKTPWTACRIDNHDYPWVLLIDRLPSHYLPRMIRVTSLLIGCRSIKLSTNTAYWRRVGLGQFMVTEFAKYVTRIEEYRKSRSRGDWCGMLYYVYQLSR